MLKEVPNSIRMFSSLTERINLLGEPKVNSRCFHWFLAAMLESFRRAPTWCLHTKHYNFQ